MKYNLSDHQKDQLVKLFNLKDKPDRKIYLFEDVEDAMTGNYLPPKGTRKKDKISDKITLLNDISKKAKQLRILIARLDEDNLDLLDSHLGTNLGEPYLHESITIGDEPAKCWKPISAIEAVKTIEEETAFTAWDFKKHYNTASAWEINALLHAWPNDIGGNITNTKDSKFIKYLSIVLEEESSEALTRRVERCVGSQFSK